MSNARETARRQEVLIRAGVALASELSLPAVLQKIVELACEVAGARYGALGVLTPDRREIEQFVTHGISEEHRARIGRLPQGKGILGVLIRDARPLRLTRLGDDPRSVGFPANHPPMTSFLGVPVAIHGQVFGNLYLTEKIDAVEFGEDDERAVITLATQAGVAVENARLYEAAELGRRRLAAMNEVATAILEGSDIEDVLRLVAHQARALVRAEVATVVTPSGDGERLVVRAAAGARASDLVGTTSPLEKSISRDVMHARAPLAIDDLSSDNRLSQPIVAMGGMGPALFVPLAVRDRAFGTLSVVNERGGRPFDDEDHELLETFAAQAAVALEYARVQGELQRLAVVEERERIAKELHDDIIQSLFAEGMGLQAAASMVHDPEAIRARLGQAVDNIDRVIRDLRNYIFGLRPGIMADRELERALRDLAAGFAEGSALTIEVGATPEAVSRLAGKANDVVQMAREAISNAVRHSGGKNVLLDLRMEGDDAVMIISDDGGGFDAAEAEGTGHGLGNLRARAQTIGGTTTIESGRGRGTTVTVRISV